jgi:predicted neutral ceramidase superfamily lipid hydrolase
VERAIRYLLPCLPPLAIIIGHIVVNVLRDSADSSREFSQKASRFAAICNLLLVFPIILGIIYYLVSNTIKVEYLSVVLPFFIVFFSGMILFSIFTLCKKYSLAIYSQLILTVLAYVLLLNLISFNMNYINPWPQMVSKLNDVRQPGEIIIYYSDENNSFIDFYLGEHPLIIGGIGELNKKIQDRV